jgi:glycosyltransferase involved in cell wall biosynthesis
MSATPPRISIVTPSFNQGPYLEETIRSVLDQNYPALEYVVIDGGSTDDSPAIIRRYADRLTHWVSEPDGGQYDAINRGFARTTGEIMGWINSDDKYAPWAFAVVADIFTSLPEVEWLTSLCPLTWDRRGLPLGCSAMRGFDRGRFLRGDYLPGVPWNEGTIQQESTFWRRSLWERAGGGVDASLKMAGDFELWARFFKRTRLYGVATPLAGFRVHGDQKTGRAMATYLEESKEVLRRHGGRVRSRVGQVAMFAARACSPSPLLVKSYLPAVGRRMSTRLCQYDFTARCWIVR